jgi:hypothetical protein
MAQLHRLEFDYDEGNGIDFEPYQELFPADETTSYTAAAVILAADAITGASPASDLFVPAGLR